MLQFLQNVNQCIDIIFIVEQRIFDTFIYRFGCRKVNYTSNISMLFKERLNGCFFAQIQFFKNRRFACNGYNSLNYLFRRIGEIVYNDNVRRVYLGENFRM